ncbi:hypothetical protein [Hymenobacter guriensis]|uniref:DinB family protein n=1 Tax=Hymenobacter guriensis TaxID=2793065 RepID=A0ABS0L7P0_9BACT|nr:hypothetical protein [Hymenobacter guriensis]MBG8556136.1 hypothetical protein [Hymenobacter guriensis]
MIPANNSHLFEHTFDTFKAFDDLTVISSSAGQQAFPASVWQILQHLLAWQAHQLAQWHESTRADSFNEEGSWRTERIPPSQEAVQAAVAQFKQQLTQWATHATDVRDKAQGSHEQRLLLQEVALHLSFHLGEVVLIRRLQGSYPMPAQMQEFLRV